MLKTNDPRVKKIIKAFNEFNPEKHEILNSFYSADVLFQDPVVQVKGLDQLKKYYASAYKNVKSIEFKFHKIRQSDDFYFATWTMNLKASGLNSGQTYPVEGLSVIEFDSHNLVKFHRDYVDLGAMVYEKLPFIGKLIRVIKSKLSHGQ